MRPLLVTALLALGGVEMCQRLVEAVRPVARELGQKVRWPVSLASVVGAEVVVLMFHDTVEEVRKVIEQVPELGIAAVVAGQNHRKEDRRRHRHHEGDHRHGQQGRVHREAVAAAAAQRPGKGRRGGLCAFGDWHPLGGLRGCGPGR